MRATGIIRKVDDLGRIIIPRDIRKGLGIKEGEPFEVYIDEKQGIVGFKRDTEYKKVEKLLSNFDDLTEYEKEIFLSRLANKTYYNNLKKEK